MSYRHTVENKWIGGKKNDSVIFIGLDDHQIIWADVMTWALNSGNELYHATLRNAISRIEVFDAERISHQISKITDEYYDRPQMSDYEYLKDEIQPPTWLVVLCFFSALALSTILTVFFHHHEVQ